MARKTGEQVQTGGELNDNPEPLPIWSWYAARANETVRMRAMHMDREFSYVSRSGVMRGFAGEWLVERPDGSDPHALDDITFHLLYVPLNPARPEIAQPPAPAPPFDGPPPEPDTEALQ